MLDFILRFSLRNRPFVLCASFALVVLGLQVVRETPVDVFPDLNRPTVTILTEAKGLAPEEVETLVTRPLEWMLQGTAGVKRLRSSSGIGLSIVWVEFDWGTDPLKDRQIVAERLQLARERLPPDVLPVMAPISSIMGEIMLVGLAHKDKAESDEHAKTRAMELRTLAEFTLRNRLLAIDGVSQVTVMGGILKQYQVLTNPARLSSQGVSLEELRNASANANVLAGGGIMNRGDRESLVRIEGQSLQLDEIAETPVRWQSPVPIRIRDVAEVKLGGGVRRGDAGTTVKVEAGEVPVAGEALPSAATSGDLSVLLTIQKQPNADTLALDRRIEEVLNTMELEIPADIRIERDIFRQSQYIEAAVSNVTEAVQDGAIWVVIVLFLLMGSLRTSVSSLLSMPLSILCTLLVFRFAGVTMNTMTLGGIAVAIGDLVDDSIVDVENIYRRLKENQQLAPELRRKAIDVVLAASLEVRSSIVVATAIVVLVVTPLFFLSGLEGRLFAPLGVAYIVSLLSSLLVSLTFTPVLASVLLPGDRFLKENKDTWALRWLKRIAERVLRWTLDHTGIVLGSVGVACVTACMSLIWMGGEFLPTLHEGTATVNLRLEPGTSLSESIRIAKQVESTLLEIPEVQSIARRTGRAEMDEHAEGVNNSEMEVRIEQYRNRRDGLWAAVLRKIPIVHLWGYETRGRPNNIVFDDIRERISSIPGAAVNIGQPISHRLDHMLSGVRAPIVIKVFGKDLRSMRTLAYDLQALLEDVPGVVDLQIEPQIEISHVRLRVRRQEAARYGLSPGQIASMLEVAYAGSVVSQVLEEDRYFSLVVWYDESARNDLRAIQETIMETPSGRRVALEQVAEVLDTTGPNVLHHENSERRIAVMCNVAGRDLSSVAADVADRLQPITLQQTQEATGNRIELHGTFESQRSANERLLLSSLLSIVCIFLLLQRSLGATIPAVLVLANVPLAALGAILFLLVLNRPDWSLLLSEAWYRWPAVWASQSTLSVAHWVGFITLIGIVSRNGILMISHYLHLMEHEGESFGKEMIIRGSLERLAPVWMTAMTSFIGLIPLLFGQGEVGKEILHPMSVVVFGGMVATTFLDQLVTPALFYRFGRGLYGGKGQ